MERDTDRNLRLFAFVTSHAARQRDKIEFDQYRPYVHMMRTRARASQALKKNDHRSALKRIDEGIKAIRRFLADYQQEESEQECAELQSLIRWRREVEREQPMGPLEKLEQQLELSVELEDYEEAAQDSRPDPPAPGKRLPVDDHGPVARGETAGEDCFAVFHGYERVTQFPKSCPLESRPVGSYSLIVWFIQTQPLPCSTRGDPFGEPTYYP